MEILHAIESIASPPKSSPRKRQDRQDEKKILPHLRTLERLLAEVLDHTATLIVDFSLQEGTIRAPAALVNPSGVFLFYFDPRRGVFRARAGKWEQLDERRKQFRPLQPNPIQAAEAQQTALRAYLAAQGYPQVSVQALIVFTDTGAHLETDQSEVRLLHLDGFPRFAAALARAQPTLTLNEVRSLVPLLAPTTREGISASREIHDDFSLREEKPRPTKIPSFELPLPRDDPLLRTIQKVPFTRRQLLVIALLVVLNLLILLALVLAVLALS